MSEDTTRRHLIEQLPVSQQDVHGFEAHQQDGQTIYGTVAYRTTYRDHVDPDGPDMPVTVLASWLVDYDREAVRILDDNQLWIPADEDAQSNVMQLLTRARNDTAGSIPRDAPASEISSEGLDTSLALDRPMDPASHNDGQAVGRMKSETGIDPSRSWGYGAGPPPELAELIVELEQLGLDPSDHLTRLAWGKKEPMDREPRPADELTGNYGVEILARDAGLIAVDIDHPDHFPASWAIPDTLEVSSPHGSDSRRHVILYCENKEKIAEEIGAWAVQGVSWGDLWIGDRYVVGPGSQLSEYGCDAGDHSRADAGSCRKCADPEAGYYRRLSDHGPATVSADRILELLELSEDQGEDVDTPQSPDPPKSDHDQADQGEDPDPDGPVSCDSCGRSLDPDQALALKAAGKHRYICPGGCGE